MEVNFPTKKRRKFRKLVRRAKQLYYQCLGWLGDKAFLLLRSSRLLSKMSALPPGNIKRILIIRIDRIGDLVLSTPTLRAVRQHFPQAFICLLARSYTQGVIVNNTDINKIITFEDRNFILEILRKTAELRKYKFDLAIVLHPNFWVNFLAFASRAKYRLGYDAAGSGFFLTTKFIDTRSANPRHEVEVNLDVVRNIGIDIADKHLEVSVTEEGERFVQDFLRDNAIKPNDILITIHPGGYYHYTHWPTAGFAKVSDYLIDHYQAKIIIAGNSKELDLVKGITSMMKNRPVIASGKTNLTQFISLLKRCKLFIGNSSGPMHIACALKVPVVAIFGNVHPVDSYKSWGPWGEGHTIISKNLDCLDCNPGDCLSLDCIKLINPEDVISACEKQLHKKLNSLESLQGALYPA